MDINEIIDEWYFHAAVPVRQKLERFAADIRERALEEAAKICEEHFDKSRPDFTKDAYTTTLQCAAEIRKLYE